LFGQEKLALVSKKKKLALESAGSAGVGRYDHLQGNAGKIHLYTMMLTTIGKYTFLQIGKCDKRKHELKQLLATIMVFGLAPGSLFILNEPKTTKSHASMCTTVPACLDLSSRMAIPDLAGRVLL
jgi:hypothetical protein